MGKVLVEESNLSSIASAIRTKLGSSGGYKPPEMAAAIGTIDTSGITPTGTVNISQNGTVDVTQYASAAVAVPNSYSTSDEGKVVDDGALVAQGSQTITQNGTYDTTLISELIANISGGGGGVQKDFLYELNYSQGQVWIDTGKSISGITTLCFDEYSNDAYMRSVLFDVSKIPVYSGGTDVYVTVMSANLGRYVNLNARIYNGNLYVSYNYNGSLNYKTKIYNYIV